MKEFFSERELGKVSLEVEDISVSIYNCIISLFEEYKMGFAREFPIYCEDFSSTICGYDRNKVVARIKGYIPNFPNKIRLLEEYEELPNKYAVLDFIEFIYSSLNDYCEGEYHSYWRHNHLSFPDTNNLREKFRGEINKLFERNGIVFYLDNDGQIKRQLPIEMDFLISKLIVNTSDDRLNELVNLAIEDIKKPNVKDRTYALEKLWDAYERIKTFYTEKKKQSTEQLIDEISEGTSNFNELLTDEFRHLTHIGNQFQVRHFETDKIQIKSLKHIDYLFYRMIAIIDLCLKSI